jgi:hypothetical protein
MLYKHYEIIKARDYRSDLTQRLLTCEELKIDIRIDSLSVNTPVAKLLEVFALHQHTPYTMIQNRRRVPYHFIIPQLL